MSERAASRRHRAIDIAAISLAAALVSLIGLFLADGETGYAPLWLANGLVVALLLRDNMASRLPAIAGTGIALLVAALVTGTTPITAGLFALANLSEISAALWLMDRFAPRDAENKTPNLVAFVLLAGGIAPVVGAVAGACITAIAYGGSFVRVALHWYTADALGTIVLGTFVLILGTTARPMPLRLGRRGELIAVAAATALLTMLVFGQARYPALFTIFPLLTVAAFRLRHMGAAVTIGIVCVIAAFATMTGGGPIASRLGDPGERILFLQLFLAVAVVSTLPVAAVLEERERLAGELRERQRAYRLLAEHSNDMIVRLGLDGVRRYVSPASLSILGHPPEALVGISPFEGIHPDDRPSVERMLLSLPWPDERPTLTYRQRHSDGGYVWLEATYRLVTDARDDPIEIVASVRDVTRRQEAEVQSALALARYRESNRLLGMAERMASIGHWRLDVHDRTLFWSEEVYRIHGRAAGDTPDLAEGIDLYHPEDRPMVLAHVERAMTDGTPWSFRARLIRPDGSVRQVESSGQPEHDDTGAITGIVGVFRDVTDEAAAEAALIAARDDAHALAEAKSAFLATMSHEIRTPMTGVLGMIELLRADPDPTERAKHLDNLEQSAALLMTVLDDVLDFSKIESGAMTLERIDFDLAMLARSTLDLFHHAASSKGLQLTLSVPVGRDLNVAGDPVRVRQVIANLVSNAIKFTSEGRVDVRIDLSRDGDARVVYGRVIDTGIGIDADAIGGLFEPFRQADASTTRRFGGSGLGLAISRRLVEAMGGRLWVEQSAPGTGSTFAFKLRLAAANTRPAPASRPRPRPARPLSILLAEDNAINRALVTALVQRDGHRVTAVENGVEAVDRAAETAFDVILMDMQMPEMDGLQATAEIRAGGGINALTPIAALTADASPERRARYADAGFDAFLTKPIDSAALGRVLNGVAVRPIAAAFQHAPLNDATLARLEATIGAANLDRFLAMLADEIAERPPEIERHIASGDRDGAARAAHALKGATLNVGADRLAEIARRIEHAAEGSGDLTPHVATLSAAAIATAAAIEARRGRA